MDVGQYPWKLLHSPDALGATRTEDLRKWVDSGWSDADVVQGDAGVVGLPDCMRGVCPGVAALVALIGYQAVTDHDEQAAARTAVPEAGSSNDAAAHRAWCIRR